MYCVHMCTFDAKNADEYEYTHVCFFKFIIYVCSYNEEIKTPNFNFEICKLRNIYYIKSRGKYVVEF